MKMSFECCESLRVLLLASCVLVVYTQDCDPSSMTSLFQRMLHLMTNDTFIAPSSMDDVTDACNDLREVYRELEGRLERCVPTNLRKSYEGGMTSVRHLCFDKEFREEFEKNVDCFTEMSDSLRECSRPYVAALRTQLEPGTDAIAIIERTKEACCSFYAYASCAKQQAGEKCSGNAAAVEFVVCYMDNVVGSPNKRQCEALDKERADCPPPASPLSSASGNAACLILVSTSAVLIFMSACQQFLRARG